MMQVKPYKHGDWCVVDQQWIDVTTKGSNQKELIPGKEIRVYIGSLNECEYFIREQNNISNGDKTMTPGGMSAI